MTEVECIYRACNNLGECPVWDPLAQSLYWIDWSAKKLQRLKPGTGENAAWAMPMDIGSLVLKKEGGLVVALRDGFYDFDPVSERLAPLEQIRHGDPAIRMNDGRCDRAGRYWCGSVCIPPDTQMPKGALYCLEPDGQCSRHLDGFLIPNGIAISPDDRTFYISDSHPSVQTIWAFDFDLESGRLDNRRVFASTEDLAGRPDGAAVDADGFYWIALIGGGQVARFAPDGTLERTVEVPVSSPTMCAFGGETLSTMFLTSMRPAEMCPREAELAGGLFAFDPGVRGLPEPRFGEPAGNASGVGGTP